MSSRDVSRSSEHIHKGNDATVLTENRCWCQVCLRILLAIVTAPYRRTFKLYTWRPLEEMRAARGDRDVLVPLVRQWKAEKYEELRSVQVSVGVSFVFQSKY